MRFRCSIALPIRTATDASPAPSRGPTHGSRRNVVWLLLRFGGLAPPTFCQFAWRTRPAHVLLSIEDYRTLAGQRRSLVDALSMEGLADIDFEPPRARIETPRADLF